jgi:hypothetical protein
MSPCSNSRSLWSLVQAAFNLVRQYTAAPAEGNGIVHIVEGFVATLAFGDNDQIVPLGNSSDEGN